MKLALRIAVADDEPDMREFFQRILPRLGHTVVVVARTGQELVEGCRREQPDLVVSDIRMPELDGLEATRQVCGERAVPVVLLSAYGEDPGGGGGCPPATRPWGGGGCPPATRPQGGGGCPPATIQGNAPRHGLAEKARPDDGITAGHRGSLAGVVGRECR